MEFIFAELRKEEIIVGTCFINYLDAHRVLAFRHRHRHRQAYDHLRRPVRVPIAYVGLRLVALVALVARHLVVRAHIDDLTSGSKEEVLSFLARNSAQVIVTKNIVMVV